MHELSDGRTVTEGGTVRSIRVVGDPVLREKCSDILSFDRNLRDLVDDMFATMYAANGVGLAANQIGISSRVFVFDCPDDDEIWHKGYVVNPTVVHVAEELLENVEGCLSIPGVYQHLDRSGLVVVRGYDVSGKEIEVEGPGYFGRCLLHETGHLEGFLFIDLLEGKDRKDALKAIRSREFADRVSLGQEKTSPL